MTAKLCALYAHVCRRLHSAMPGARRSQDPRTSREVQSAHMTSPSLQVALLQVRGERWFVGGTPGHLQAGRGFNLGWEDGRTFSV